MINAIGTARSSPSQTRPPKALAPSESGDGAPLLSVTGLTIDFAARAGGGAGRE
jgi:hypothetical protein